MFWLIDGIVAIGSFAGMVFVFFQKLPQVKKEIQKEERKEIEVLSREKKEFSLKIPRVSLKGELIKIAHIFKRRKSGIDLHLKIKREKRIRKDDYWDKIIKKARKG